MEGNDRAEAVRALRAGLDAGMTHVDTAEMYGAGRVESIVAEAIAGRRDEIFLVSKVLPSNASRKGTLAACEESLTRLKTDRLDLYLLHWPGSYPLADTIAAFEELVATGKIRFWGVSNFDDDELEEAARIAGPRRIACNQVLYHLEQRAIEHRVIPWCAKHEVAVVGYSPFGAGAFPAPSGAGGKVLEAIAKEHGATARQVALAFLLREPGLFTIPKAAKATKVIDNAGGAGIALTAEQIARIDATFPRGPASRGVPTL